MPDLAAVLGRLSARLPKGFDLSLERIQRLLAALGDPQDRLPPVIHVAGTNGKGSTIAFMRAVLEAAGRRVHTHTSPHLVRYNERYRIATGPGTSAFVDDATFADALARVEAANGDATITLFEVLTAAAFVLFAEIPADVVLLEVGLGGRFDATNVVKRPLVTAITSISIDHQAYLGDRLEQIAFEKAGILKPGVPAVLADDNDPSVVAVVELQAARLKAPLLVGGQDFSAHEERGRLVYQDGTGLLDLAVPRLPGRHQYQNAATAIAALRRSGLALPDAAYERGIANADWPARLQRLAAGALVHIAAPGAELWLDGGHNPGAGEAVAAAMADLSDRNPRPLHIVAGMLTTKDPVGFFRPFEGLARHVFTVPVAGSDAGYDPAALAEAARTAGLDAGPAPDFSEAIRRISFGWDWTPGPRILVCGSLYLAGAVLAANGTPPG